MKNGQFGLHVRYIGVYKKQFQLIVFLLFTGQDKPAGVAAMEGLAKQMPYDFDHADGMRFTK